MSAAALTVGCDPEFFLYDQALGKIVPALGKIGGSKKKPFDIGSGVGWLEDNVALEFNMDPVKHIPGGNELFKATRNAKTLVTSVLRSKINTYYSLMGGMSAHTFTEEELEVPGATSFGCEPDLDAYLDGAQNPIFSADDVGQTRFTGGHMHFGYDKKACPIPVYDLVKMIDTLVTYRYWYNDGRYIGPERMKFYGKPGAYRDKPYGFEYRTPSNMWCEGGDYSRDVCDLVYFLINNPSKARVVYDHFAFGLIRKAFLGGRGQDLVFDDIQKMWDSLSIRNNVRNVDSQPEVEVENDDLQIDHDEIDEPIDSDSQEMAEITSNLEALRTLERYNRTENAIEREALIPRLPTWHPRRMAYEQARMPTPFPGT